jgi:DNA-binding LacI/PurR family transcriptional regulator
MNDPVIDYLKQQNFPFVMVGKPYTYTEKISYVDNDNIATGRDITQHLIQLGHERIGFVGGSMEYVLTQDRLTGYKEALAAAKISYDDQLVVQHDFLPEGGYQAMRELVQLPSPPTALVINDDIMALGVMSALNDLGLSIPEQISIGSINDFLLSKVSSPPLTTIIIGIYDLGYEATNKLLHWVLNGEQDVEPTIIPHEIKIRQSTAPRRD